MPQPKGDSRFIMRVPEEELSEWTWAAEVVAVEQHAKPNVSALVRKTMAAEVARMRKERKRGAK